MAQARLDLVKEVFNKAEYIKTIDTSFNELGAVSITEDQQLQPNIEEFFGLYNSLFYDIPALGETNSHQYLVRTSGEYINFDEVNDEIQALQAEIAQLRSDLLTAQMENARIEASKVDDPATNEALLAFEREIQAANENIIGTNTTLSEDTNTSINTTVTSNSGNTGASTTSTGGSGGGGGGGGY